MTRRPVVPLALVLGGFLWSMSAGAQSVTPDMVLSEIERYQWRVRCRHLSSMGAAQKCLFVHSTRT